MQSPDPDHGAGLIDLTALSLDDLGGLVDSVVASALRELQDRRRCGSDYLEVFNAGHDSSP